MGGCADATQGCCAGSQVVFDPVHKVLILVLCLIQFSSGMGGFPQTAGGYLWILFLNLCSVFLGLGGLFKCHCTMDASSHQPVQPPDIEGPI